MYVVATTVMSVVFICDTGSTFGHVWNWDYAISIAKTSTRGIYIKQKTPNSILLFLIKISFKMFFFLQIVICAVDISEMYTRCTYLENDEKFFSLKDTHWSFSGSNTADFYTGRNLILPFHSFPGFLYLNSEMSPERVRSEPGLVGLEEIHLAVIRRPKCDFPSSCTPETVSLSPRPRFFLTLE